MGWAFPVPSRSQVNSWQRALLTDPCWRGSSGGLRWGWPCVPEILGFTRGSECLEGPELSSTPMGRSRVLLEVQSETLSWLSFQRMLCTRHSPFPARAFLQKTRPVSELLPWDVWLSPQFSSVMKANGRFFFSSAILLKESLYLY